MESERSHVMQWELRGKFGGDCLLCPVHGGGIAPLQEGVEVSLGHDLVKRFLAC